VVKFFHQNPEEPERNITNLRTLSRSTTLAVSRRSASARELMLVQAVTSLRLVQGLEPFFASPVPPWKRAIDIVGSVVGLVLFSPVFLLTAILIKVVSPGPVFFKQERVGHGENRFLCWKFRTMEVGADISVHEEYVRDLIKKQATNSDETPMAKLDSGDDHRIIPLGRIIRQTAIDELPQLINVLRGEMSLVGPRPCIAYELEEYLPWHRQRFDSVPGLTGLWQVSGKNKTTFTEMIRFDIAYGKQKSLWVDFDLLLKTLPAIVKQVRYGSNLADAVQRQWHRTARIS
jgi:lipopolysaccharide/colanic/teichoic acid biosynthesis glycosyltransferase